MKKVIETHTRESYGSTSNTNHTFRYTKIFWLPCFATCYIYIFAEKGVEYPPGMSGNRQWYLLNINICTLYIYIFEISSISKLVYKGYKCALLLHPTMILIALFCNLLWHPRGTHYFELLFCCSREGTSLHTYSSVNKFMPVMNYTPIKYSGHISIILVQQCHVNHLSFRFIDVMISVVLPSFTTRP